MTRYLLTYKTPAGEVMRSMHMFLDRAQLEADAVQKRGDHFLRITDMEPGLPPAYSPGHRLSVLR